MCSRYGTVDYEWGIAGASTDFVSCIQNLTYIFPPNLLNLRPGKCLIRWVINIIHFPEDALSEVVFSIDIPALHPGFGEPEDWLPRCSEVYLLKSSFEAIPTVENGGNHTPQFAEAAATVEAHQACLDISKALAATAVRCLLDDGFFAQVKYYFWGSERSSLLIRIISGSGDISRRQSDWRAVIW